MYSVHEVGDKYVVVSNRDLEGEFILLLGKDKYSTPKVLGGCVEDNMPLTDMVKKRIAQQHKLYMKICRDCGARNASSSNKCRKCRGNNLRWKKRELGAK